MELTRDNVKVEWEAIGEGLYGDYNPNNPDDIELLRFYVSVLRDGTWEEKEDASYCTNFPVSATAEEKMAGLEILLDRFHAALSTDIDASVKKLGEELSWIGLNSISLVKRPAMNLREFLSYFDFDYDIVSPGEKREDLIRQELIEEGKLTPEDADQDLICLIDCQGAYFGNIGNERFPIAADSVGKIIARMDIYIEEFVTEFREALETRDVDPEPLSLGEMIDRCKALGVDSGEVCYTLADAVNRPEIIYIEEVRQLQLDIQNQNEPLADIIRSAQEKATHISKNPKGREPTQSR